MRILWIIPLLGSLAFGLGGPAFVQQINNCEQNISSGTLTCSAFASNVTSGDTVIVMVGWGNQTATLTSIAAACVTGNLTLVANPTAISTTWSMAGGYGVASSTGGCAITMTISANTQMVVLAQDCTNCGAFDSSASPKGYVFAGTITGSTPASGSITTTQADYCMGGIFSFAGNGASGDMTAGSGWTTGGTSFYNAADGMWGFTEYKVQGSSGATNATFSTTTSYINYGPGEMCFLPYGNSGAAAPVVLDKRRKLARLGVMQ